MKTKKISIVVLSAVAAFLFALAGFFAFGTKNKQADAETAPAEITLVTAGYATESSKTVTFKGCTWEGSLPLGDYYGNVYVGETAYIIRVHIQNVSGYTADNNLVFFIKDYTNIDSPVDFETEITSFTVKKGEAFLNKDNSASLTFAKEYTVTYTWNSTPTCLVGLVNVTLTSGGYSDPNTNLARVLHSREDSINNGFYYGDIYNADGTAVISGTYIDYANGNLRFYFPDRSVLKFMVKAGTEFKKSDGTQCIIFAGNYIVTINWGGNPVVTDVGTVSLGAGVWSTPTGQNGNPQYTVSMNSSAGDGSFIKGYYYGNIYSTDGSVYTGAYLDFLVKEGEEETASGKIVATFTNVKGAEKITEFVLKSTDLFKKGDGRCPFYFDRDYLITVNWGGVPNASCDFTMKYGAAIRLGEVNGLRFSANVAKSVVEGYRNAGYTVSAGMVILPYDYIEKYGDFSATNVFGEAYKGVRIIDLAAELIEEDEETYRINGSIVEIKDENLQRAFVGRAYLKLEKGGGVTYIMSAYADFNIANNSRTVMDIAQAAYDDSGTSEENKETLQTLYSLYLSKKK